jgi:hypothetical protein
MRETKVLVFRHAEWRRLSALGLSALLLLTLTACGSDESRPASGAGGAMAGASGFAGTAAGGASMASSGGASGAQTGGASSAGAPGTPSPLICPATGMTLPTGACYIPCTYDFGNPPRYESPGGHCSQVGWRCSVMQYCDPNIHCTTDMPCQTLGGPNLTCVPAGPLVGECLIRCNSNADCPNSMGATTSPYTCQTIDTGAGVVHVCGI